MTTSPTCRLTSLVALALLGACSADSREALTGPGTRLAADLSSSDAPRFSEWSAPVNLGSGVNTALPQLEPCISKDGLSLFFQCLNCPGGFGGFDIWVAERASLDDPWGVPVNLGPTINTEFNDFPSAVSTDGHRLYMNSDRPGLGGGDLYVARRHDKRDNLAWGSPENLGSTVNTAADDFQGVPFEDEETGTLTLYFSSNRPGGAGGIDIYAAPLQPDETFGPAVLVAELSTPSTDQQPAIRRDGLEMLLTSNRPGTLGGTDLWVATRATTSDPWSTPVNLGSPVNSPSPDAAPAFSFDGTQFYFQSGRPGGFGQFDLYVSSRSKLGGGDNLRQ